MRGSHRKLAVGAAFCALTLAVSPILGVGAGASGPGPNTLQAVPQGFNPAAIPGATVFGTTPASTPEEVSFILNARNEQQLSWQVENGMSSFLSVSQFAQEYGQSNSNISQLESYLAGFGIATSSYADNLDVTATGTAGEFDAALSVQQHQYQVPSWKGADGTQSVPAQTVHAASSSPLLPYRISQYVLAILGLTNYGPFTSQAVHVASQVAKPQSGGTSACLALSGLPNACNTPSSFESDYGLSRIEHSANGSGETLAIVTLAALDVGAPQYFWSNVLGLPSTGRTVTVQNVDGGPGAPSNASGSGETDLDVEQSGGVAPGANVIVYQAPNTDFGFADAFFQAASQNVASSVSSSWGESETVIQASVDTGVETPAYQTAFDEAFMEMAAQGQSGFVSAGDSGAYDAQDDAGTTNLAVDSPGSSPYITVAGGTTQPWSAGFTFGSTTVNVNVTSQRAWAWDYLWPVYAAANSTTVANVAPFLVVGGGGGFSSDEPLPSYQQGVPGTQSFVGVQELTSNTPVDIGGGLIEPTAFTYNANPSIVHGRGSGRAMPDLSTNADPYSGYLLYSPSFADAGLPLLEGGWGGTSFVAPQLNGSTAVIDSYLGHRVGFWNPAIYGFATSNRSPFTPLQQVGTSNDNNFYTGNPGTVFNEATGLGVPDLSALTRDFANGNQGFNQN